MADSKKNISVKNYVILLIIMGISIFLVYYFYLWFQTYDESRLNTPIMNEYLQVINYNELNDYITENKNAVVYVSVLGNEVIRDFEKELKTIVVDFSLKNEILYMDITNELNNGTYMLELSDKYGLSSNNIPSILVFEDGELIDTYDIASHDYSMKKVKKYLTAMGVIGND